MSRHITPRDAFSRVPQDGRDRCPFHDQSERKRDRSHAGAKLLSAFSRTHPFTQRGGQINKGARIILHNNEAQERV